VVRLHPLQQVANAAAFELEDALRFAAAEDFERLSIIQWELLRIDSLTARVKATMVMTGESYRRSQKIDG